MSKPDSTKYSEKARRPQQPWEMEEQCCKECEKWLPVEDFHLVHLHRPKPTRDGVCIKCRSQQKLRTYEEWKKTKHRFQTWLLKSEFKRLKQAIQRRGENQQTFLQRAVRRELDRCDHEQDGDRHVEGYLDERFADLLAPVLAYRNQSLSDYMVTALKKQLHDDIQEVRLLAIRKKKQEEGRR